MATKTKNSAFRYAEDKEANLSYYYGHKDAEQGKDMQRDPFNQDDSCEKAEAEFEKANTKRRDLTYGNS